MFHIINNNVSYYYNILTLFDSINK